MKKLALLLSTFLVLQALPAIAALPDLSPLTARYRITVNGIPAGAEAKVEIRPVGAARYETSFRVQNRFFRHDEVSRFDWNACHITAREYRHEFSGLGIDRESALVFDWQRMVAIESRGEKVREITLTPDIADGLNMAMLARCRLREGKRTLDFPVIYRGERKPLHFEVTGNEKVETPIGTFDTLVIERRYPNARFKRTRVWVAPALDWFMVRFEHVENPAARGSLLLTDFVIDGKKTMPAGTVTTPGAAATGTSPATGGRTP